MKFTKAIELHKNGSLQKISNSNEWIVNEEFIWFLNYEDKEKNFVKVESGFIHDFGSIPQIFWFFLNPTKYVAYILHDYLYVNQKISKFHFLDIGITRKEADLIMLEALKVEGMNKFIAYVVYGVVRLFGWYFWNRNKRIE